MNINYTLHAFEDHACDIAQAASDANGAPVAVLARDGWFRVVESADLMELLVDFEHWRVASVVEPMAWADQ